MASKPLVAVVLGATGAVGTEVVSHLLASDKWGKIVTIGRRPVELPDMALKADGRLEQLTINMDNMAAEAGDAFKDADTVFCALGTTRGVAGSADAFRKVDLDWVVESARLAKEGGCRHFSLVSAQGANANTMACDWKVAHMFLYMKTKGMAEEAAKALNFERLTIFRPGMLERGERMRPLEKMFIPFTPTLKVADLGRLIVQDAEACGGGTRGPGPAMYEMKALMAAAKAGTPLPVPK